MVDILYDNLVAPKIPERALTQYSGGSGRSDYSYKSHVKSSAQNQKFKHEKRNFQQVNGKGMKVFPGSDDSINGENEQNLKKAQNWNYKEDK